MDDLNGLIFDEEKHEYIFHGVVLPSVTQILNSVGVISPFSKNEEAALRGTYIHKACALAVQGQLDPDSVDERIAGYIESFIRFLEATPMRFVNSEQRLASSIYGYAGTYDLLLRSPAGIYYLIDIKSGVAAKWHKLQTAAYTGLVIRAKGYANLPLKRGALYLQKNGTTPAFFLHSDRNDWQEFLSHLQEYHHGKRESR